jgi:hypothetical protein
MLNRGSRSGCFLLHDDVDVSIIASEQSASIVLV